MTDQGWKKSTYCATNACVEILDTGDVVHVRDRFGTPLTFTREEWGVFLKGVKAGEFDGRSE